jgi:hypothetical protein
VQLAEDLGYPYTEVSMEGDFTGGLYPGFMSRFPVLRTENIVSRGRARELTRAPFIGWFNVPGSSNDAVVVNVHYKGSFSYASDFRRAVESLRTLQALQERGLNSNTCLFIVGSFNDDPRRNQTESFNALPAFMPKSYVLDEERMEFPLPYAPFPDRVFSEYGMHLPQPFQVDGRTLCSYPKNGYQLDYILISDRIARDSAVSAETYKSHLDLQERGLPKKGDPPPPDTSETASDHLIVFGDFEIEQD